MDNLSLVETENFRSSAPLEMDFFMRSGFRHLALDMLIDSARTVANRPNSAEAQYEYQWLRGKGYITPLAAADCFDFISDETIDSKTASENFIRQLNTDANALLDALLSAKARLLRDQSELSSFEEEHEVVGYASPRMSA